MRTTWNPAASSSSRRNSSMAVRPLVAGSLCSHSLHSVLHTRVVAMVPPGCSNVPALDRQVANSSSTGEQSSVTSSAASLQPRTRRRAVLSTERESNADGSRLPRQPAADQSRSSQYSNSSSTRHEDTSSSSDQSISSERRDEPYAQQQQQQEGQQQRRQQGAEAHQMAHTWQQQQRQHDQPGQDIVQQQQQFQPRRQQQWQQPNADRRQQWQQPNEDRRQQRQQPNADQRQQWQQPSGDQRQQWQQPNEDRRQQWQQPNTDRRQQWQQPQENRRQSRQQHTHNQQRQQQPWQPRNRQQQQRQQQQPPPLLFQGGGSSSSETGKEEPQQMLKLLTHKISRCDDLDQIQQILQLHPETLDAVIISAAISRLAKLYPGRLAQQQQQQQHQHQQQQHLRYKLQQLIDPLLHQFITDLSQASVTEISCVVGGLARLGYEDCYDVISACVDASRNVVSVTNAADNKILLQLAWGLARIGHKPDEEWLQLFENETYQRLPTLNNIETANLIWVFAKWDVKPSTPWITAYLNHLPSQLLNLQPPEICSIFWSVAMLQLQLPANILDSLLLEAQVKFVGFTGQGFGTLAWSLARRDLKPKRMWIQDFVRHSGSVLPALSSHGRDQAFTNILWALGCWEHIPPQQWLPDFCRCVVPQLQHMTPQGLTIIAVGLAELHHKPPAPFTCYLLELFHQRLAAAAAKETASFIWALPRLLLPETLSAAVAAAGEQQPQQQQRGFGRVGIATAGWLRQYCWLLQDMADHLLPGLEKLSPTDLADTISGFADLGYFPGISWMDSHEVNLNRQLDHLTTVQINIVKQGYMRLEQIQQQQDQLLHPEQIRLLQQQQRAAAAAAGKVPTKSRWQSERLAGSAAAAAAATAAAGGMGLVAATVGAEGEVDPQQQQQQRDRRLRPPAWATTNASSSDTGRGRGRSSRGRGRGRGRGRHRSTDPNSHVAISVTASSRNSVVDQEDRDLSIGFGAEKPLVVPKRPRAARIRIQRLREAEKEQRQQEVEEWRQRFQQKPRGQQWRVAQPDEFTDDD